MAQTGQAKAKTKVASLAPNATVKIDSKGGVDNETVEIPDGGIVKFESETGHSWEIAFDVPDGGYYPMTLVVPAFGAAYLIGQSPAGATECDYDVLALGSLPNRKSNRMMGNNKIVIGGDMPGGQKKRK
ncbi:MAG: hypothetical protein WB780_10715 [Candidatus Acidiferrales bacterium]